VTATCCATVRETAGSTAAKRYREACMDKEGGGGRGGGRGGGGGGGVGGGEGLRRGCTAPVLLSTRRAPRLTEAAISAYVFNTAAQSKGGGRIKAQGRATCGVGGKHCHDEVCSLCALFGGCSGRASSGGELGHGVGAEQEGCDARRTTAQRKHARLVST
jgi:hypothetical protein